MGHPAKLIEEGAAQCGSQAALAKALGVSAQAVAKWKRTRVPSERVLDFERITNVSRHRLRPDLYPAPSAA